MNYSERCYWNNRTYGSAFRIQKWKLHTFNLSLGIVIPVLYPIPLAAAINKFIIKKDLVVRYE